MIIFICVGILVCLCLYLLYRQSKNNTCKCTSNKNKKEFKDNIDTIKYIFGIRKGRVHVFQSRGK